MLFLDAILTSADRVDAMWCGGYGGTREEIG